MKVLHLTLKKKWFDLIASGKKKEEYREIKPYWINRLTWHEFHHMKATGIKIEAKDGIPIFKRNIDSIVFKNGYAKDAPIMEVEFKGITIGKAIPEWSDNWQGDVFIIQLGAILSLKNYN